MMDDGTGPGHANGTNKQRRSGRLSWQIPILLIGSDAEGTVFSEQTKTVVLSQHGTGIASYHKLVSEQELTLRVKTTNREAEVRVVEEIAQEERQHTYGVCSRTSGWISGVWSFRRHLHGWNRGRHC